MKRFMLACFFLLACSSSTGDPAPYIDPKPTDLCDAACQAMSTKLTQPTTSGPDIVGCEEGLPVPLKDGGSLSCVEFCVYQHDNGIDWNNACIAEQITTCEEIETVCNASNQ